MVKVGVILMAEYIILPSLNFPFNRGIKNKATPIKPKPKAKKSAKIIAVISIATRTFTHPLPAAEFLSLYVFSLPNYE